MVLRFLLIGRQNVRSDCRCHPAVTSERVHQPFDVPRSMNARTAGPLDQRIENSLIGFVQEFSQCFRIPQHQIAWIFKHRWAEWRSAPAYHSICKTQGYVGCERIVVSTSRPRWTKPGGQDIIILAPQNGSLRWQHQIEIVLLLACGMGERDVSLRNRSLRLGSTTAGFLVEDRLRNSVNFLNSLFKYSGSTCSTISSMRLFFCSLFDSRSFLVAVFDRHFFS